MFGQKRIPSREGGAEFAASAYNIKQAYSTLQSYYLDLAARLDP